MEFSPDTLFRLSAEAWIWGLILGTLSFFTDAIRHVILKADAPAFRADFFRKLPLSDRILPKKARHGFLNVLTEILIFLMDVGLSVTAAIGLLLLAFIGSAGRIRMACVLMMLIGFFLVKRLFRRPIQTVSRAVIGLLCILFRYLRFLLLLPFLLVGRAVLLIGRMLLGAIKHRISARNEARYRERETLRMMKEAEQGFSCIPSVFSDAKEL